MSPQLVMTFYAPSKASGMIADVAWPHARGMVSDGVCLSRECTYNAKPASPTSSGAQYPILCMCRKCHMQCYGQHLLCTGSEHYLDRLRDSCRFRCAKARRLLSCAILLRSLADSSIHLMAWGMSSSFHATYTALTGVGTVAGSGGLWQCRFWPVMARLHACLQCSEMLSWLYGHYPCITIYLLAQPATAQCSCK